MRLRLGLGLALLSLAGVPATASAAATWVGNVGTRIGWYACPVAATKPVTAA